MRVWHETLRRPGESLPVSNLDPAAIAQGVRQIAHDLHQMLRKTTPSPGELIELERRIDELRVHTHGTGLIAIDRWLASSRSAIRARAYAEQTSTADKYYPGNIEGHIPTRSASEGPMKSSESRRGLPWTIDSITTGSSLARRVEVDLHDLVPRVRSG